MNHAPNGAASATPDEVARRRRGELTRDRALVATVDAWMRAEDVADPEAVAAMLVPRLPR